MVKDTQRQHGLRHNDYLSYRQYCTRRLERLRDALKFHYGGPKGSKLFQKKEIDAALVQKDIRYLHIVLFQTERVSHPLSIVLSRLFLISAGAIQCS